MTTQEVPIDDLTEASLKILEVASELFYRHGIHAVGVDTIAEESGVTKRTLYNNFGSKDALVSTYLSNRHSAWWQRLEDRIAALDAPRALAFFDVYADEGDTVTRGCAFLNAAAELPRGHAAFDVVVYHKRSIEERLAELIAEDLPDAADPQRLARHVFLLLEGAFVHQGIHGDELMVQAREIARDLLT
ncbi:TetR/AcrR family transcriptional regulator [Nocardioides panacisoli]|uniref:TetR/AcrR family transcriptional regulator n=1 Tax=Nocardioides panacisoli TaxID=627624 RepID=UPI001C631C6F|nr:TetR/AcrR family transcriptional regulator [Nocardioides panacisoli]QYJ03362.1 TetR/AcrR family transcriptional regulator [Nocardioides panacisoli]